MSARTVLQIDVANHPGVMSHVVGLFSRRLFNVEGILCLPLGDGAQSRIWLLVNDDERLPQMIRQLEKLVDVAAVQRQEGVAAMFTRLPHWLDCGPATAEARQP